MAATKKSKLKVSIEGYDWEDNEQLKEWIIANCTIEPYGCWIFAGYDRQRFGGIRLNIKKLVYQLYNGKHYETIENIHRVCKTRKCVNPAHLALGKAPSLGRDYYPSMRDDDDDSEDDW